MLRRRRISIVSHLVRATQTKKLPLCRSYLARRMKSKLHRSHIASLAKPSRKKKFQLRLRRRHLARILKNWTKTKRSLLKKRHQQILQTATAHLQNLSQHVALTIVTSLTLYSRTKDSLDFSSIQVLETSHVSRMPPSLQNAPKKNDPFKTPKKFDFEADGTEMVLVYQLNLIKSPSRTTSRGNNQRQHLGQDGTLYFFKWTLIGGMDI